MNKDKKTLYNNDLNQSTVEDLTEKEEKSKQFLDIEIVTLEKKLLLEQDNLCNKKKCIEKKIQQVKKRIQKDIEYAYKFSLEKFINELLQVIDNLERALLLADKSNDNFKVIIDKLESTLKLYLEILSMFGLEKIKKINIPFNPDMHQAMSIQFSESIQDNHVVSVLQNGYLLNNRLLRPAMVIVSKNKK